MEASTDTRRAGSGPGARSREEREAIPGVGRPKALFFLAAGLSFAMSVYLFFGGHAEQGIFVGLWVPSILALGAMTHGRSR